MGNSVWSRSDQGGLIHGGWKHQGLKSTVFGKTFKRISFTNLKLSIFRFQSRWWILRRDLKPIVTRCLTHRCFTSHLTALTPCCCCCRTIWQNWRMPFLPIMLPNGWNGWSTGVENADSIANSWLLMWRLAPVRHLMVVSVPYLFPRKYSVSIPKFSIKTSYSLKNVLTEMGMVDMFGDRADLSGIAEGQRLAVSEVKMENRNNSNNEHRFLSDNWLCLVFLVGCPSSYPGCWWGWSHCRSCYRHHNNALLLLLCSSPEVQSSLHGYYHWPQHR